MAEKKDKDSWEPTDAVSAKENPKDPKESSDVRLGRLEEQMREVQAVVARHFGAFHAPLAAQATTAAPAVAGALAPPAFTPSAAPVTPV
jgi:hypothetical protein